MLKSLLIIVIVFGGIIITYKYFFKYSWTAKDFALNVVRIENGTATNLENLDIEFHQQRADRAGLIAHIFSYLLIALILIEIYLSIRLIKQFLE